MTNQKPNGTIKLQGIPGYHPGTPVSELIPGDIILWNFGETSKVLSIEPIGTASCKVTTENHGKQYIRNMRRTRLVVRQAPEKISVCDTARKMVDRAGATLRPLTMSDRAAANTDSKRNANYMLCVNGQEWYTDGTIRDIKSIIKSAKHKA